MNTTNNHQVLVVGADIRLTAAVLEAAADIELPVQLARTTKDALRILFEHRADLDVVIVDLESTSHGLTVIEALDSSDDQPAAMALVAVKQSNAEPIVQLQRSGRCFVKPVSSDKLAQVIEEAVNRRNRCGCLQCSCDRWGHRQENPTNRRERTAFGNKRLARRGSDKSNK